MHASVSRIEPSAVWYLAGRFFPRLYEPSATLSATLLAARRICRARSGSRRSIVSVTGRNLAITPNKLVPKNGVYAVWVDIAGKTYPGALNAGYRPTFGENRLTVEAFVFDFEGDIYNQDVRVRFVQRIRDEKRFDSPDALVEQIRKDVARSRRILKSP